MRRELYVVTVALCLLDSARVSSGFTILGFNPLAAAAISLRTCARAARLPFHTFSVAHPPTMVTSPYATKPYPVGTPGTPWGAAERAAWKDRQVNLRSYYAALWSGARSPLNPQPNPKP